MRLLGNISIVIKILFLMLISVSGIFVSFYFNDKLITGLCMGIVAVIFILFSISIKLSFNYINAITFMMSMGDFGRHVDEYRKTKDEIGQLNTAMSDIMENMNRYTSYIAEIERVLGSLSTGDMKIELREAFDREFEPVKRALLQISSTLNKTLSLVSESSYEVHSSADQVANSALSLATTTSIQAQTIDDLQKNLKGVSDSVSQSAENAKQAENFAKSAENEVKNSVSLMEEMLKAMENMQRTSDEVLKINKVIDDIAFQTNILSLNANIEAAKAGEMGRGFAVVATQVRILANKSADAAKQTSTLIQKNVQAVKDSGTVADSTSKALEVVDKQTKSTMELISKISFSAQEQATAVAECAEAISGFSSSVQSVAVSAIGSSEAGHRLTQQADILADEVAKFKTY
ncbi:MAG: methyl-accepting chemotaxis protein [Oscillospiraceae bacterium]|jgi:methyl-accepting chemotaxis protein|nr:methyl-accepting chemotaxis protein [Oscillospiraceae bacterium]